MSQLIINECGVCQVKLSFKFRYFSLSCRLDYIARSADEYRTQLANMSESELSRAHNLLEMRQNI